jgi:hypothetical protein
MTAKTQPPPSVTNYGLNMIGVFGAVAALYVLRNMHMSGSTAVFIVCAAGVVPIIALDVLVLRVHRRESTGLDWDKSPTPSVKRVATKLLGLAATVGPIGLCYWVFPEYGDWYNSFWKLLRAFGPGLVTCAIAYMWIVDGHMREPNDTYWQLGRWVLGHREDLKKSEVANHYRGWVIKGFYLPLFIVFTHNQLDGILTYNLAGLQTSNMRLYHFLSDFIYALDVLYATVGYILSFRVIDTHLRTAEPTMFGWVVALECYMPFWGRLFSPLYLHYDGIGFENWLSGNNSVRWVWAGAILVLEGIYLLATFAFGVRFSNLTHRGILCNGPYRFTKHPAYVAKNMSWWLITLPFIPFHGWIDAVKSSFGLAGVSTIYFLRARTEERHLSRDPVYVQYALWMNEHGVLRFLNRWSFFKYKAPPAPVAAAAVVAPAAPVDPPADPPPEPEAT